MLITNIMWIASGLINVYAAFCAGKVTAKRRENMNKQAILSMIKEVRETRDMKEAALLLSSGIWIAIDAVMHEDSTLFVMARIQSASSSEPSI